VPFGAGVDPHPGRTRAHHRAPRHLQFPAQQRAGAVGACEHQSCTMCSGSTPSVKCNSKTKTSAWTCSELDGPDDRLVIIGDRAADHQRTLGGDAAWGVAGLLRRQPAGVTAAAEHTWRGPLRPTRRTPPANHTAEATRPPPTHRQTARAHQTRFARVISWKQVGLVTLISVRQSPMMHQADAAAARRQHRAQGLRQSRDRAR